MNLGTSYRRGIAVVLVAVFNAACFYTLVCPALCAFRTCAPQPESSGTQPCHNHRQQAPRSQPSDRQHEGNRTPDCTAHGHVTGTFTLPAGFAYARDLTSGMAWLALTNGAGAGTGGSFLRQIIVLTSPPGFLTGRTVCSKKSLLRI